MDFTVEHILWTCLIGVATAVGWVLAEAIKTFLGYVRRGIESMENLNIKMAVIVSQVQEHDRRISEIEASKSLWERITVERSDD